MSCFVGRENFDSEGEFRERSVNAKNKYGKKNIIVDGKDEDRKYPMNFRKKL